MIGSGVLPPWRQSFFLAVRRCNRSSKKQCETHNKQTMLILNRNNLTCSRIGLVEGDLELLERHIVVARFAILVDKQVRHSKKIYRALSVEHRLAERQVNGSCRSSSRGDGRKRAHRLTNALCHRRLAVGVHHLHRSIVGDGAEETADPEYRAVTAGGVEDEVAVERAVEDAG